MTDSAGASSLRTALRGPVILHSREKVGWLVIAAAVATTALLMAVHGLSFDWFSAGRPLAACWLLLAGAAVYRSWRPDEPIAVSLAAVAQLLAFAAVAETLSYAIASLNRPLWDDTLIAWDTRLGLDWQSYLMVVDARPWLAAVLGLAYKSLVAQVVAAAVILGLTGRYVQCRTFILAFGLAALLTVAMSGLMPAVSEYVHLGLHPADVPNVDATAAFAPIGPFERLRSGALHVISLTDSEGIIAFPSFHAALGILFIAAFWPLRWLRWPGLVLNILLLASTPVNGGHYFVDVIAGSLVGIGAIAAAHVLDASCGRGWPELRRGRVASEVPATI